MVQRLRFIVCEHVYEQNFSSRDPVQTSGIKIVSDDWHVTEKPQISVLYFGKCFMTELPLTVTLTLETPSSA